MLFNITIHTTVVYHAVRLTSLDTQFSRLDLSYVVFLLLFAMSLYNTEFSPSRGSVSHRARRYLAYP